MTSGVTESKKEGVVVSLLSGLSLAIGFLALASAAIPFIGERLGLVISALALLAALVAMAIALGRNSRLVLPTVALVFAAVPAARSNWQQFRTVWVESAQICNPPRTGARSLLGLIGGLASTSNYQEVVGSNVCSALDRKFTDHECTGYVGRIKCEP